MSSYVPAAEPIQDQIGYLTLNETGGILASGGDLENDEKKADIIYRLLTLQQKVDKFLEDGCTRISINYKNHAYVACMSNKKIHIIKKKLFISPENDPFIVDTNVPNNNSINA